MRWPGRIVNVETSHALRAALLTVWERQPEVVLDAATAAHVAGGICWAVGKANALFKPQGERTMGRVKEALALHATISTYGKVVQRALVGYREPSSPEAGGDPTTSRTCWSSATQACSWGRSDDASCGYATGPWRPGTSPRREFYRARSNQCRADAQHQGSRGLQTRQRARPTPRHVNDRRGARRPDRGLRADRLTPEEKIRRMEEIAKRSTAKPGGYLTDDDLYDEWGLPH